jgi:hypothetical protein
LSKYLKVHALRIIQDERSDVTDKIPAMHHIYRAISITIADAAAYSSREGFLPLRERWRTIRLPARFDENVFGHVVVIPTNQEDPFAWTAASKSMDFSNNGILFESDRLWSS